MIKSLAILMLCAPMLACELTEPQVAVRVLDATNGWITVTIDKCLAPVVTALQTKETGTITSCCGHGKRDGFILLGKWVDGRLVANRLMLLSADLPEKEVMQRYHNECDEMSRMNDRKRQHLELMKGEK